MKDQFRHENLQPSQVQAALREFEKMGYNPQMLQKFLSSAEDFNAKPLEMRQQFFAKVAASEPMRTSAQGERPPMRIDIQGVAPDPLESIIQERMKTAPKGQTLDLDAVLAQRIEGIKTGKKEAAAKEAAIQQAAVPQIDASGRVVRDVEQPRKTRSVKDYLVGGGEALLTGVTGMLAAPPAATAQLLSDIPTTLAGKKPKDQGVFSRSMERFTYAPRTETAKDILGVAAKATEALPPVLTPEFMALAQARPGKIVTPKAVPGYVAQTGSDVAAAVKAIPGDIRAAAIPALEGIGMRSVGAAGRANQTRFEAAVNMLPEAYRAQAQALGWKKANPAVIEAHGQALNLPVPVQLTAGQATGDIVALSREYNQRGKNPELAYRFNEQNRALVENLEVLRDMAAPDVFDTRPVSIGSTLKNAYLQLDNQLNADIDAKYTALRDAAGGQFPVDVKALYNNSEKALKKNLLFRLAEKDLPEFRELKDLAESGAMDFETYQNLRRNLGTTARSSSDGNVRMAARLLIEELEKLPLSKQAAGLKSLADEARAAARDRFSRIEADPAYKAAINNKVADERFVDTFLFGARGTQAQLRQMIQNLGEDQKQVLAAAVMQRIRDKAVGANGDFSPAAYAKEFKSLEPKLLDIFPGEMVQQMRDLGDVAKRVKSSPSGSFFNRSGTLVGALAEQAAGAAEQGINLTVMSKTGIPVPVATLGRERLSARKAAKETERTLEPLAGATTKLKDIGKD